MPQIQAVELTKKYCLVPLGKIHLPLPVLLLLNNVEQLWIHYRQRLVEELRPLRMQGCQPFMTSAPIWLCVLGSRMPALSQVTEHAGRLAALTDTWERSLSDAKRLKSSSLEPFRHKQHMCRSGTALENEMGTKPHTTHARHAWETALNHRCVTACGVVQRGEVDHLWPMHLHDGRPSSSPLGPPVGGASRGEPPGAATPWRWWCADHI